jgi:hypothetical protein
LLLSDLARSALLVRRSSAAFEDLSWSLQRFSISRKSSSWVFCSFSRSLLDCSRASSVIFLLSSAIFLSSWHHLRASASSATFFSKSRFAAWADQSCASVS